MEDVYAYLRDATGYDFPSTHGPKRLHRESSDDPGSSACNGASLVMESPFGVDAHPESLCRRCFRGQPKP